jgi:uncharacterized protein YkwD
MGFRFHRGVARLAVLTALTVGLVGPLAAGPAAAANTDERQLQVMVNDTRDKHDVGSLQMRRFLVRAARRHSQEMASTGVLEHTDNLASVGKGRQWKIIGENVGYGPSVDILHDAFLNSPPHRENELNAEYRWVGVGFAQDADGKYWVTVLFMG